MGDRDLGCYFESRCLRDSRSMGDKTWAVVDEIRCLREMELVEG